MSCRGSDEGRMELVREAGVEPTTFGSGGRRSIQLSYSRKPVASIGGTTSWFNAFIVVCEVAFR